MWKFMLHQNCLSDGWTALETPQPSTVRIWQFGFTLWMATCADVKRSQGLNFSLQVSFCHFSCEQLSAALQMLLIKDCLKIIAVFNNSSHPSMNQLEDIFQIMTYFLILCYRFVEILTFISQQISKNHKCEQAACCKWNITPRLKCHKRQVLE